MKTSYNEACGRDCSTLEQDLALCEQAGFDYIEIRLDMLRRYLQGHTAEQLRAFFDTHRLKPHAVNAVYLRQGMPVDWAACRDEPAMQDFRLACETCRAIGSRYVVVVPPLDPSGVFTGDADAAQQDCVRILKQLSALARPYGVRLCFELVGLPKSCVRDIAAADRIVRAVDEDNVGFVFDSYNIYLNGRCNDFSGLRAVQPEKIFAVHLMSADDVPEEQMGQDKRCFPGRGVVDTGAFLQTLRACGYEGMVSVDRRPVRGDGRSDRLDHENAAAPIPVPCHLGLRCGRGRRRRARDHPGADHIRLRQHPGQHRPGHRVRLHDGSDHGGIQRRQGDGPHLHQGPAGQK